MKLFKSVLKQGLKAGAIHFKFTAGVAAQWTTATGKVENLATDVPDEALMSKLLHDFFPQDQKTLATGKAVRGRLAVVNHGELMLLGTPGGPASLEVFVPPAGEALFATAWEKASRESSALLRLPTDMFAEESNPPASMAPVAPLRRDEGIVLAPKAAFKESQPTKVPEVSGKVKIKAAVDSSLPPQMAFPDLSPAPAAEAEEANESPWAPEEAAPSAEAPVWAPGSEMSVVAEADARFQVNAEDLQDEDIEEQQEEMADEEEAVEEKSMHDEAAIWQQEAPAPVAAAAAAAAATFYTPSETAYHPIEMMPKKEPLKHQPTDIAFVAPPPPPMTPPPVAYQHTAMSMPPGIHGIPTVPPGKTTIVFGAQLPGESREQKGTQPIDAVLALMVQRKASDLHLSIGEPIALRLDGDVVRLDDKTLTPRDMERYLLPILTPRHTDDFAKDHDVDFAYEVAGLGRFRVNMYRDIHGVGAVFRMIPEVIPSFEQLKLPETLRRFCELEKGLVLVTGPTGSGKSTTLAAMIDMINRERKEHILTIEDPVEFQHKPKQCIIHQREVHRHTKSFSRALRAALREDPDTVLIGEMRDLETIGIALETAETGHLVFGTLHTNTAISTVDRIIDQFPANQQQQVRIMLAETLRGVVSQVLIKKRGGGRVAAHEILVVSKAVSSMIREGKTHMIHSHMQTKKSEGNLLLHDSLTNLLNQGVIDAQDAYAKAADKDAMLVFLQKKGIATPFAA